MSKSAWLACIASLLTVVAFTSYTYGFSARSNKDNAEDAALINASARRIVAQSPPGTSDIDIVGQVIDAAHKRRSVIGESLVAWYTGELTPGDLMRRVIDNGFVTNFRFRHDGGDFLLPTTSQRTSAGPAFSALSKLFETIQAAQMPSPWVIDEDDLMMAGFATGGVPVLNVARVRTFYSHIQRAFDTPDLTTYLAGVDQELVAEMILANEMAHAYLYNDLRLSIDQDHNRARFVRAAGRDHFVNTRQIHEFISDAASINTNSVYVFLQWMILPTRLTEENQELRVRSDDPYAYSLQFLIDNLEPLLRANGKSLNLALTHERYTQWMRRLQRAEDVSAWQAEWDGFERWLEADAARVYHDLGADGRRQLQHAYQQATHELLPVIVSFAGL